MYYKANTGKMKLRWRNGSASVFGTEGWEFDPPTDSFFFSIFFFLHPLSIRQIGPEIITLCLLQQYNVKHKHSTTRIEGAWLSLF